MSKISKINVNGTEYDLGAGGGCDVLFEGELDLTLDGEDGSIGDFETFAQTIIEQIQTQKYKYLAIELYSDNDFACGNKVLFAKINNSESLRLLFDIGEFSIDNELSIDNDMQFSWDCIIYKHAEGVSGEYCRIIINQNGLTSSSGDIVFFICNSIIGIK